ncbi:hypothetical protein [Nocardia sp. NPDC050435]|uniref:hypothetical protein n=1 Tax=Nocardia sp. NPDC050435 TaxID=3155040 RepID=UPI0033F7D17F
MATATMPAPCRAHTHANGLPWVCDRPRGHAGPHQVHFADSRAVAKSWTTATSKPRR